MDIPRWRLGRFSFRLLAVAVLSLAAAPSGASDAARPAPAAAILYSENFNDGLAQDWYPDINVNWLVNSTDEYVAFSPDATDYMVSLYGGARFGDASVQVTHAWAGLTGQNFTQNPGAVVLRATADFDLGVGASHVGIGSAYVFQFAYDNGGAFSILKQVDGQLTVLRDWTATPEIVSNETAVLATAQGSSLWFFIYGAQGWTQVWRGRDSSLTEGYAGLAGYTTIDVRTDHYFDDVFVTTPFPDTNDDFAYAFTIGESSGHATGSNAGATKEPGEPDIAGVQGGASVWWDWTAPSTGRAIFDTNGSGIDTLLGVFTGSSVSNLREIAGDDDSGVDAASLVVFTALGGTTYHVAVDGVGGEMGDIALNWTMDLNQGRLSNISTRGQVKTGDFVMIAGFIIEGNESKQVAVTGWGPSLADLGVPGVLADPYLSVYSGQTQLALNDDWTGLPQSQKDTLENLGLIPSNDLESAILLTLNPGQYTAILQGIENGTGNGLVAVWDADPSHSLLTNISTRGFVGSGNDVMIAGFIIAGLEQKTVVVTAWGPSLTKLGVPDVLQDPILGVFSGQTLIVSNDNWQDYPAKDQIIAVGLDPSSPKESAVILTLDPGEYTAVLSGVAGGVGNGLIAVWDVSVF